MTVSEAIRARRTIRKFSQEPVADEILLELVDGARVSPCAANQQPLKYKIVKGEDCEKLFPHLNWAVMIAPQLNPAPEERPTAYLVITVDPAIRPAGTDMDVGIAAQTIALAAQEKGIASALLSLRGREEKVRQALSLPEGVVPALAVALGYPAMQAEVCEFTDTHRYYLDEEGVLQVPKRALSEVLL